MGKRSPYKKKKKVPLEEKPIHFQVYAQKSASTHRAAARYLDWWIREYGNATNLVSGSYMKVGH